MLQVRNRSCQLPPGTENVPLTRPLLPVVEPGADLRPSTLARPELRSIVRRPPFSVSLPRRKATPPDSTMTRRLKS